MDSACLAITFALRHPEMRELFDVFNPERISIAAYINCPPLGQRFVPTG